jgi:subtilisin family serine protease
VAIYDHLPLRRLEGSLERRQHGFGAVVQRDAKAHGAGLKQRIETIVAEQKAKPAIAGVDPALILKIRTTGGIPEETWRALGLTLLSDEADKSVVLFANDKELTEFKRRIEEYQKGTPIGHKNPAYANLVGAIEEISGLSAEDRVGPVLQAEGKAAPGDFGDAVVEVLDVELWQPHPDEILGFVARVESVLHGHNGALVNEYRGSAMTLLRVRAAGAAIRALLDLPEVYRIDRPPQPDMPQFEASSYTVDNFGDAVAPPNGAIVIGVIDSGMTSAHPLANEAVRGAFGIPDTLGDNDDRGHGTSVAGIAIYGDVRQRIEAEQFEGRFFVASAKVVDQTGNFPSEVLVPQQMELAIRRLHDEFHCRVINISLGDCKRIAGEKPTPWASVLDALARELDLIIVVSAGNRRDLWQKYGDGVVAAYPNCLTDTEGRILEPGTAVNVLTVGSLTHSNGLQNDDEDQVGVVPLAEPGYPSPFTRVGPGVGDVIKPDFVDFGGTVVFDGPTQTLADGHTRPAAGVISLHRGYVERLLTSVTGTSFASPLVAYKAALVREAFPGASANLTRALLAISAEWPEAARDCLEDLSDDDVLPILGNGLIDVERALNSNDNRVVLYREDSLDVNRFAVYEVPIPQVFQPGGSQRRIRVALAFDPIVRHTRLDYAGLGMSFDLYRGATAEEVFDACRKWEKAEGEAFRLMDSRRCKFVPSTRTRGKGTLQCGTFTASRSLENYGDTYYLAVRCEGGWANELTPNQHFAVAVELQHEAEIALYQRVQQRVQLPA